MIYRFLLAAGAVLGFATAVAQTPPAPPPLADFWRAPAYAAPVISPNGQYMAVAVGTTGRMNLGVIDLAKRSATALTSFKDFDVIDFRWVGNERLVFTLGQRNTPTGPERQDGGGLFMISRDGKESRVLSRTVRDTVRSGRTVYRGFSYVRDIPDNSTAIIASARERSAESLDLYRLDVTNARKELLTVANPGRVVDWVLDRKLVPRIAVSVDERRAVYIVRHRPPEGGDWQELWRSDIASGPMTVPLYFEGDNQTLVAASNEGRETMGIFRYDIAKRARLELLAQHPRFDMGADQLGIRIPGLVLDPKTEVIVGFRVLSDRLETVWTDAAYQRLQASIDNSLPGMINVLGRARDGGKLLIGSYSDRQPVRWYLLDEATMSKEELMSSRPWLTPDRLVEMKPFYYRTRDGLEILSYLLLPADRKPGVSLPTVIHIHGGPWVRADQWGFGTFGSVEGQILASRGYAVVVPNFRITPGLGSRVFYSGRRQFGRAMQDDIEDVTDWAVKEGIADPQRICLSGASYGGYAALMGVAKTPDKYRCAVAGLAVTDLELLMTSGAGDISRSDPGLALWTDLVGDPATNRDALRAVSPALLADRIKAPVLMYSGASDIRVPLEQPQKMRRALEAQGRSVRWIVKADEGHGFGVLENNIDLYTQMLDFLGAHIGSPQR